jgi:hypothetical protein
MPGYQTGTLSRVEAATLKEIVFPLVAGLGFLFFLPRAARARQALRDPTEAALLIAFGLTWIIFAVSTPSVSAWLDQFTGVHNLSALIIDCSLVLYSCVIQTLVLMWVYPPEKARPAIRRRVIIYGLVLVTMISLFLAAGSTHGISVSDYFLHYADKPPIAAYLALYLVALSAGLASMLRICLRYAGEAGSSWLRRGLQVSGAGCGIGLAYCACRVGTGVSPLLGWPRGIWELGVAVFGGSAAVLILIGLTLPSWGPSLGAAPRRLGRHLAYCHLHPLWTAITAAAPEVVLDASATKRLPLRDLDFLLPRLIIEIRDGQRVLQPLADPATAEQAEELGQEAGLSGDELGAAVQAAILQSAIRGKAEGAPERASAPQEVPVYGGDDLLAEVAWLKQVARAFSQLEAQSLTQRQLSTREHAIVSQPRRGPRTRLRHALGRAAALVRAR